MYKAAIVQYRTSVLAAAVYAETHLVAARLVLCTRTWRAQGVAPNPTRSTRAAHWHTHWSSRPPQSFLHCARGEGEDKRGVAWCGVASDSIRHPERHTAATRTRTRTPIIVFAFLRMS